MTIRKNLSSATGIRAFLLAPTALVALATPAAAQNATWLQNPGSGSFNDAANWSPATVPTGTASFGASNTTALSIPFASTVGGWTFNLGASAYSFEVAGDLTFNGAGILINGGSVAIHNSSLNAFGVPALHPLNFFGTSTAGNAQILNDNALLFHDNSTAGTATITNNGALVFVDSSTGGTARLVNGNAGIVTIASAPGMSLGSIEGSGVIAPRESFTVGGNNLSTTFSGNISGIDPQSGLPNIGSLTKVGTGTLTLTGVSSLLGGTFVNGGTLQVDGSLAISGVTVNNGGRLTGVGEVGTTAINSGGILASGSGAPGTTLSISGNLALQSGALYVVQLNSAGQSSKAAVDGNVTLSGATVQAVATPGNYSKGQSFAILTATGTVSGTFGSVTSNINNFTTSLSYTDPTMVVLTLATATLGTGTPLNTNQQNVANAINQFSNGGGMLPSGFNNLFGLTGTPLANSLAQLSGELGTAPQQVAWTATNLFMGVMTDPFIGDRSAVFGPTAPATAFAGESERANAYAGAPPCLRTTSGLDSCAMAGKAPPAWGYEGRWSQWAAGFGGAQSTSGNATLGSNTTSSRIGGIAVGADYRFSPWTIAGLAFAGGVNGFNVANGGSGTSEMFQAGAFARHTAGPVYLAAALAYGFQDVSTNRTVTIGGAASDQLHAQFNTQTFSGRLETGARFDTPWTAVIPYAAGQFTLFDLPRYAESIAFGANTFGIAYDAKHFTAARTELGLRGEKSFAMADGIFTLRERVAWAHDYNTSRNLAATFQTLPGASFVVNGAAPAANAALTTLSAEQKWLNGFSLAAAFEGEFSQVTRSYAGKGVLRYVW